MLYHLIQSWSRRNSMLIISCHENILKVHQCHILINLKTSCDLQWVPFVKCYLVKWRSSYGGEAKRETIQGLANWNKTGAGQSLFNQQPQSKAIQASFPDKRSCGIPPQINFSAHTFLLLLLLSSFSFSAFISWLSTWKPQQNWHCEYV